MSLLELLRRDGWLRAVDHALALSLRRLDPDTDDAVLVAAALASRALAFGHSGLPLDRAGDLSVEIAPEREAPQLPEPAAWAAALHASPWVASIEGSANAEADPTRGRPLVFENGRVYLRRYRDYEFRLAAALRGRAESPATQENDAEHQWREARLRQLFPALASDARDAQAAAARLLPQRRLLMLTGGPGTGKTTTVARALLLLIESTLRAGRPAPRLALAAPTGKAAARLAEAMRESIEHAGGGQNPAAAALPTQAATLHRLLGWRPDSVQFQHDGQHPLPADIVVVDEASMVDLPLMCKLVEAVSPSSTLLLIGDRDQLPSVETGDVLAALCDAAQAGGVLAPHRVALTRSWRLREEIDVGELAALVRDGDVEAAMRTLQSNPLRGIRWLPAGDRTPAPAVLAQALPAYRAVQQANTPAAGLALAKRFRVLTAVREGAAGSVPLNAAIAQSLQPPGTRGERFFHGALVIVGENSYRHGLFNGDIGLVWREDGVDGQGTMRVWFERSGEGDGGLRSWLPSALPAHELAFALTVHKSQGSEFDEVFLALPPAAGAGGVRRALSRELLYTGLTRCRRGLTLWAQADALRAAIERPAQRWSGLTERLR